MITIGRWEWRGFGDRIEAVGRRLSELVVNEVEESDEIYLLSAGGDASVKVRGGLLDVKRLVEVSDKGLEQWLPIAKDPFPVTAANLRAALAELGVDLTLTQEMYGLAELHDVLAPCPDIHVAEIHKTRRRYTVDGCMTESTAFRVSRRVLRTIAVESENHDLVLATLRDLGLRPVPNLSVPRALKRLLGIDPLRYGVVDVGTNSVKFHLAECTTDGEWRQLVDRAEVTRLGEGLAEAGELRPLPMERTATAIAGMVDEAWEREAEAVAAVGTAGLRAAANSADFVDAVWKRSGIRVEVISGEEEARLAFLAGTSGIGPVDGHLVAFETGGGSTQFTFGHDGRVEEQFSVAIGAVRLTERFGLDAAVDERTLVAALDAIADDLSSLDGRPVPDALVAMGGAVTNLAAVKHELELYDPEAIQGTVLDIGDLDLLIERFRTRSAEQRRAIVGLQPARAEVILAGACVVRVVMKKLGRAALTVSDRGLRHRLLVERFGRPTPFTG